MSDEMFGGEQVQLMVQAAAQDPPPDGAGDQATLVREIAQALHTGNAVLNEMVNQLDTEVDTALEAVKSGAGSARDKVAQALDSAKAAVNKLNEITDAHGNFLKEVNALGRMLQGAGRDVEASVVAIQQMGADLATELSTQQEKLNKIHDNLESANSNLGG